MSGAVTVVRDVHGGHARPRLDTLGAILATAGLVAAVFGFAEAENMTWGSRSHHHDVRRGRLLLLMFVAHEARARTPCCPCTS